MSNRNQIEEFLCEGCSGRGQCHEKPCVEEAEKVIEDLDFGDPVDDAEDLATDRIWSKSKALA